MPQFIDETLARVLYRKPQPQTHVAGQPVTDPVPPLTYGRPFYGNLASSMFNTRKNWLTGYGLDNNADVLVVGSGFGFLLEFLLDAGIECWGIEPGSWFWDPANDGEWRADVKVRTVNDWIGSGTEQAALEALPGTPNRAKFTWIIDEDCATMHSDAELPAFIAACEDRLQGNARGRIVHIVTPLRVETGPGNQAVNWKLMADWKAVAPAHTWVNTLTGEVEP